MPDPTEDSGDGQNQCKFIAITYLLILSLGILNVARFGWKLLDESLKPEPVMGILVGAIFLAIPIFAAVMLRKK